LYHSVDAWRRIRHHARLSRGYFWHALCWRDSRAAAWSTAGIIGPVIVNYLHDTRLAAGVPRDRIYGEIFYLLAALLALGFLCNAHAKWHMTEDAGKTVAGRAAGIRAGGGGGIGRGGLDAEAVLAWAAVGIPLSWGVWKTLENAAKIFL
jgi:hypothetical protein